MIYLATILIMLAALILVFALRGRIAQRGAFCRRCKFDLAGLPEDKAEPRCPECGADLASPKAIRQTLRRRRPIFLTLGILLLLAGTTLVGIVASNNTAQLMATLPDRVVLTLHAMGMDAAFTEIATNRLTQAGSLSQDTWDNLIADAAAHQRDPTKTWDPRHGEVLLQAFTTGRLTPAQVEQYFNLGFENTAEFPDEIRHGAEEIGVQVSHSSTGRISVLSSTYGQLSDPVDTVWKRFDITAAGVIEPAYQAQLNIAGWTGVNIPSASGGGGRGSTGGIVPLSGVDWDAIEPGSELEFFVEYSISIARMSDDHVHYRTQQRVTQPIRILPPDADHLGLDTHSGTIDQFQDRPALLLSPLCIVPKEEREILPGGPRSMQLGILADNLTTIVAGQVVVIHDGQEHRIGEVSVTKLNTYFIGSLDWTRSNGPSDSTLQQWLDAGQVTIEIRPDPQLAEQTPGVDRILGVPLRFEQVPVTEEEIDDTYSIGPRLNPRHTVGRPVTESTNESAESEN